MAICASVEMPASGAKSESAAGSTVTPVVIKTSARRRAGLRKNNAESMVRKLALEADYPGRFALNLITMGIGIPAGGGSLMVIPASASPLMAASMEASPVDLERETFVTWPILSTQMWT